MRKIIIIILIFGTTSACGFIKVSKERQQEIAQVNRKLPYGSELLASEKIENRCFESQAHTIKLTDIELKSIENYYKPQLADSSLILSGLKEFDYIKLGDEEYCFCLNGKIPNNYQIDFNNYNYRLPDNNGFHIYYSTGKLEEEKPNSFCRNTCLTYGNLILYNYKSAKAHILNIFFEGYGDQHTSSRYFFIDENYNIKIFENFCYDDGCVLIKKYIISIGRDQRIKIFTYNLKP